MIKRTKNRLVARLFSRYPAFLKKWASTANIVKFDHSPWATPNKAISQSRLALITTGGVHLKAQTPFDMTNASGDPTFREIPADTRPSDLAITHDYYDHKDADQDINIMLPVERVKDLEKSGDIGAVNGRHFSFMGHITAPQIDTLTNETAPEAANILKSDGVDIVILTPA